MELFIVAKKYVYHIYVISPSDSVVLVRTNDEEVGDDLLYRLHYISAGSPLEFEGRGEPSLSGPVEHLHVGGFRKEDGEFWLYEVY